MVNQLFTMDLFLSHALLVSSLSSPYFFNVIFFDFSINSSTFQCIIEREISGVDIRILPEATWQKLRFCVCVFARAHSQKEESPWKTGKIKMFFNTGVGKTEGVASHRYSQRVENVFSRLKEDHSFIKVGLAQSR